ncbi:MAG: hypothetical protein Q9159_003697 [Coniocarpon cinnabarinum]
MAQAGLIPEIPQLVAITKPVSLIPVGVKEAALDSPTFRASVVHFSDQIEAVERWLEGLARIASKLAQESSTLESVIKSFTAQCNSPSSLSEAVLDHDYTLSALRALGQGGAQDVWLRSISGMRAAQSSIAEPIRQFIGNDIRPFKEARRTLDQLQKANDTLLLKYAGQSKTKEPSSLREDAFQLHEARKAYLRASLDIAVISPQIRLALDTLLVKVCNEQWTLINYPKQDSANSYLQYDTDMKRIKTWAEEVSEGEKPLRKELLLARRDIEEKTEASFRPSRELDDYAIHTVPYLGSGPTAKSSSQDPASSKQGWLFLRTITGKPARTHWVRRWFFVKNGIFGCLIHSTRTGGVEESEKIGVLLCGVRPAFQEERRFCFEVKTKDSTILLQAETQPELTDWIQAFEAAKKKAIEDPEATDMLASSNNPAADAAFAVSPAIAPELAAKGIDGQITTITEDPQANLLAADTEGPPTVQVRNSFDVNASRRLEGDIQIERTRDHAARILEKLDIHKKSTAGSQLTGGLQSPTTSAGMSSLLGIVEGGTSMTPRGTGHIFYSPSLAPSTLATPPVQTHLSKTALKIGVDRGVDLGAVDNAGGVPSGLMANQWGSTQYGYISRLERGEVGKKLPSQTATPTRRSSDPTDAVDSLQMGQEHGLAHVNSSIGALSSQANPAAGHRKTTSAMSSSAQRSNLAFVDYPDFYPAPLKPHDAQFRMLFPNVPHHERLVMVFRAAWNPDSGHSLPGRVFVTQREMFFYSHHMGMVVVHGASLDGVSEVSHESEEGHNFLMLHMKDDVHAGQDGDIMLKIYLDSPILLQQRLEYLIQSNDSEEPDDLQTALQQLVKIESNLGNDIQRRALETTPITTRPGRRMTAGQGTRIRVDRGLGGDAAAGVDFSETTRFKLPAKPVSYMPLDVKMCAAEKIFDLSAKGLLHVLFGDKSAVCPTIYQQQGSEVITQHPWVKASEQGNFKRQFDYETKYVDSFGRTRLITATDLQSIDVAVDHLCYMVTDIRVPWHLPQAQAFSLVSKVVVTHEAKSKSKLCIYVKINWTQDPWVGKSLIERRAMDDMQSNALNMMDIVTEQVEKLGPGCSTRRVMEIFGSIGQLTEAAQVKGPAFIGHPLREAVHRRTVLSLYLETCRSMAASIASSVLMLLVGTCQFLIKTVNAHSVLVVLLSASLAFSFLNLSQNASIWWHERHTSRFMADLGVGPNLAMSKSIYLADIPDGIAMPVLRDGERFGQCSQAFQSILNQTSLDETTKRLPSSRQRSAASAQLVSQRLRQARQRLGTYRHDLMVALRLVNRVERDAVQAEYESWLLSETRVCTQMEKVLSNAASANFHPGLQNIVRAAE